MADSYVAVPPSIVWKCVAVGTYAADSACKPGFPEACATDNYCKTGTGLQALTGTCTAIPAAGEPCGTGSDAQCQANAACVAGLCQNLAPNGVSCTGAAMCYSENCVSSGSSSGCQAKLPCQ